MPPIAALHPPILQIDSCTRPFDTGSPSSCSPRGSKHMPGSPGLSVVTGNLPPPCREFPPITSKRPLLETTPSPLTPKIDALFYRLELVDSAGCGLAAVEEENLDNLEFSSVETNSPKPSPRSTDSSLQQSPTNSPNTPSAERDDRGFPSPSQLTRKDFPIRRSRSNSHSELAKTAVGLREIAKKIGRAQLIWDTTPKTVLIVTKVHDQELVKITKEVTKWLILDLGMTVLVESKLEEDDAFQYTELMEHLRSASPKPSSQDSVENPSEKLQFWTPQFCSSKSASCVDFVITLGGDGTVLYAAWMFQKKCPPILPFRLGSLGFLTTFDFTGFRNCVENLAVGTGMEKGMRMNFRMRFSCTVIRHRRPQGSDGQPLESNVADDHNQTFQILNDLTIDRGPSPYMSQLELYGNEHHLTTIHADGLTISTPTGSTAYSLSAGGSLVHPDVSAILVTPICPHTLSFRPMILPDTMEVCIMVPEDSRTTAWASFDGRHRVCLERGDGVVVRAAVWPVPTVCWEDQSKDWFKGLERCLGWNRRERQKGLRSTEDNMEGMIW
ncbi:NAD+ kinase [Spizellomyces sp. 'palustris']|nr:NAD+ kinase [Spizellomyces sp. 'palustris']